MASKGLTDAELTAAVKSRREGTPLPSGVNWSPTRTPQFMSIEEAEEYYNTGVIPKTAADRANKESKMMGFFDFQGKETKTPPQE